MKRFLFPLLMLCSVLSANAQFKLTEKGYIAKDGRTFAVMEHEGTKAELFNGVKSKLMTMFQNPERVMSCNEPDLITLNAGAAGICFFYGSNCREMRPSFRFKMNIYFKDGKVRFDAPIVLGNIMDETYPGKVYYHIARGKGINTFQQDYYFYTKEGKVRDRVANEVMEGYINDMVNDIMKGLDNSGAPEDW